MVHENIIQPDAKVVEILSILRAAGIEIAKPEPKTIAKATAYVQKMRTQIDSEMITIQNRMREKIIDGCTILKNIDQGANTAIALNNPYVVSVLYYSNNYLEQKSKEAVTPQGIIVRELAKCVTKNVRKRYIEYLHTVCGEYVNENTMTLHKPLGSFDFGVGSNHEDALDLFTTEQSSTFAMDSGIIVLAEDTWKHDDSLSTSSLKGGNTVIMYNPKAKCFYRYAHLDTVKVKTGDKVLRGTCLGTVGHTGLNAHKPGHGNHLHLEMNAYSMDTASVVSLKDRQIKELIR